jgi:Mrp family chromosome partitioning ATPase
VSPDWSPDAHLDPAPCRPLTRELFAFGVEHCFVIGVTAVPTLDRDKSEFAGSLALALSATGHARVLLVEGDLDRPTQHQLMRAEMPAGQSFSRQLQAHMTRRAGEHWSVLRCTKSLHLLVDEPERTPGLILSRTFEECLRALRAYYDFIVVDGPPGSRESECRALDGVIDGLIVVCTEETRAAIPETSRFFTTKRFSKAIRATR